MGIAAKVSTIKICPIHNPKKRKNPEISIRLIEILNSTFDPKWL